MWNLELLELTWMNNLSIYRNPTSFFLKTSLLKKTKYWQTFLIILSNLQKKEFIVPKFNNILLNSSPLKSS